MITCIVIAIGVAAFIMATASAVCLKLIDRRIMEEIEDVTRNVNVRCNGISRRIDRIEDRRKPGLHK